MSGLLQISDTHFGTEQPQVAKALLNLARQLTPTLLVLSGDVTQRATTVQFQLAQEFLDQIDVPSTLVIPGNHDIPLLNLPLRLLAPFRRFRRAFGRDLEPVHQDEAMTVIGVNSVMPRWHKDGAVDDAQIDRVSVRLSAARASRLRIVVCHHPVLVIKPEDETNLMHGSAEAVRRWVAAGADLILGGHIHLPYLRPLKHRLPELTRQAWALQAGTAVSSRIRAGAPNSVNHVRPPQPDQHGPGACQVDRWDFQRSSGRFERVSVDRLQLDRSDLRDRNDRNDRTGQPDQA